MVSFDPTRPEDFQFCLSSVTADASSAAGCEIGATMPCGVTSRMQQKPTMQQPPNISSATKSLPGCLISTAVQSSVTLPAKVPAAATNHAVASTSAGSKRYFGEVTL